MAPDIRRADGFTLIELLIATGLSTMIIVGIMAFQNYSQKSIDNINLKYRALSMQNEIFQLMRSQEACTNTIFMSQDNSHSIRNSAGAVVYEEGLGYQGNKIKLSKLAVDASNGIFLEYSSPDNSDSFRPIRKTIPLNYFLNSKGEPVCQTATAKMMHTSFRLVSCSNTGRNAACTLVCPFGYSLMTSHAISSDESTTLVGLCEN